MKYTRKTRPAPWTHLPATASGRPRHRAAKAKAPAPWPRTSQANTGAKAKALAKPRKRVRAMTPGLARERRRDAAEVRAWKVGRLCACAGHVGDAGAYICRYAEHPCEDRHHIRGRLGPLLRDKRYWLPVCRKAHQWIDAHRAEAKARGWLAGPWNTVPKEKSLQKGLAKAKVKGNT